MVSNINYYSNSSVDDLINYYISNPSVDDAIANFSSAKIQLPKQFNTRPLEFNIGNVPSHSLGSLPSLDYFDVNQTTPTNYNYRVETMPSVDLSNYDETLKGLSHLKQKQPHKIFPQNVDVDAGLDDAIRYYREKESSNSRPSTATSSSTINRSEDWFDNVGRRVEQQFAEDYYHNPIHVKNLWTDSDYAAKQAKKSRRIKRLAGQAFDAGEYGKAAKAGLSAINQSRIGQTLGALAGPGGDLVDFGLNLVSGQSVAEAGTRAGLSALGATVGAAALPVFPLGGAIAGGMIGDWLGGKAYNQFAGQPQQVTPSSLDQQIAIERLLEEELLNSKIQGLY